MVRTANLRNVALFVGAALLATAGSAVTRTHADGTVAIAQGGGAIELGSVESARLATGGGAIHVAASRGDVKASTGGGDIHIGTASGAVNAATGSGEIRIDAASGPVNAATGNGDVTVSMCGSHDVKIASGSGTITLRLPANVAATFDVETAYRPGAPAATIRSDFPLTMSTSDRPHDGRNGWFETPRRYVYGTGAAGAGTAHIRLRSNGADIRIVKL